MMERNEVSYNSEKESERDVTKFALQMKLNLDDEKNSTGPQRVGLGSHERIDMDFSQRKEQSAHCLGVSRFFSLLLGGHL